MCAPPTAAQVFPARRPPTPGAWLRSQVQTVLFFIVIEAWVLVAWQAGRADLGEAVMLARNGANVLRVMTSAASGVQDHSIDFRELQRSLPWLPAYDRRDVVTIKTVLDRLNRRLNGAALRRGGTQKGLRERRKLQLSSDDTDAVAHSIFVGAMLRPSPGDRVEPNKSLEQWLGEVGIRMASNDERSQERRTLIKARGQTPSGRQLSRRLDSWRSHRSDFGQLSPGGGGRGRGSGKVTAEPTDEDATADLMFYPNGL